jgi:hypothetical protein
MENSKKVNQKWKLLEKKADLRESTKLFPNLTTDSDSATQNPLRTVEVKHRNISYEHKSILTAKDA